MPTNLDRILTNLIESAKETGREAKTKLAGGLIVTVRLEDDCNLRLILRRSTVYPSLTEWRTVLNHLPWPCSADPQLLENNSMSARIKIQPELFAWKV